VTGLGLCCLCFDDSCYLLQAEKGGIEHAYTHYYNIILTFFQISLIIKIMKALSVRSNEITKMAERTAVSDNIKYYRKCVGWQEFHLEMPSL